MKYHHVMILLLVAFAVLAAGCTGGGTTNATTTAPTAAPTTGTVAVTTAVPATLQTLPGGMALGISANRQPYNRNIVVTFNGGSGQGSVTAMTATIVHPDGTTESKPLGIRSGSEVTLTGTSPTGTDTVYVTATLTDGNTYRFFQQSLE